MFYTDHQLRSKLISEDNKPQLWDGSQHCWMQSPIRDVGGVLLVL